jgi:hypothetical protein
VDEALVEPGGVDQQLTDQRGDRAVPGGLRGDDKAMTTGEPHRLHDVLRAAGREHGVGVHLDREVPRGDEGDVVGVTGDGDGSGGPGAQLLVRCVSGDLVGLGHCCPPGIRCGR